MYAHSADVCQCNSPHGRPQPAAFQRPPSTSRPATRARSPGESSRPSRTACAPGKTNTRTAQPSRCPSAETTRNWDSRRRAAHCSVLDASHWAGGGPATAAPSAPLACPVEQGHGRRGSQRRAAQKFAPRGAASQIYGKIVCVTCVEGHGASVSRSSRHPGCQDILRFVSSARSLLRSPSPLGRAAPRRTKFFVTTQAPFRTHAFYCCCSRYSEVKQPLF